MIGQHIFSRCLGGYFSQSTMVADSTTVTIAAGNFAQESHARLVAKECEKISTLEDSRSVPDNLNGKPYRGVLKIRCLNAQITVVCRSYRLHWVNTQEAFDQTARGESRGFTYSSNYLVSDVDRENLLRHPECFLNIQDFEPYPSVMRRIEESRNNGHGGRIEASTEYSLFKSPYKEVSPEIFLKAGFTESLFVDYISSIIERVSLQRYQGHENGRVLVILPDAFNAPWRDSGGNVYAEQVLAITMKILPEFVSGQLNAFVGGLPNPDSNILHGYQLVFMENGNTREWRKSEYSIIDLNTQSSYVTPGIDKTYAGFLWENLYNSSRLEYEERYKAFFGADRVERWDNSLRKLCFFLEYMKENRTQFSDTEKRGGLLADIFLFCGERWEQPALDAAVRMLELEEENSCFCSELEKQITLQLEKGDYPEILKEGMISWLVGKLISGGEDERSVKWLSAAVVNKDHYTTEQLRNGYTKIRETEPEEWIANSALLLFYRNICDNKNIAPENPIKKDTVSILLDGYGHFQLKREWGCCVKIIEILSKLLNDPYLEDENRKKIYSGLFYMVFFGEDESVSTAISILDEERNEISGNTRCESFFWDSYCGQMKGFLSEQGRIRLNDDVIRYLVYFALSRDDGFMETEWAKLYREMLKGLAEREREDLFESVRRNIEACGSVFGEEKTSRLVYLSEKMNLVDSGRYYRPAVNDMRAYSLMYTKENGLFYEAAELLYLRFILESEQNRDNLIANQMRIEEKVDTLLMILIRERKNVTDLSKTERRTLYLNRETVLMEMVRLKIGDEDILKRLGRNYLYILKDYVDNETLENERSEDADLFVRWFRIYTQEMPAITRSGMDRTFISQCRRDFTEILDKTYSGKLAQFDIGDFKDYLLWELPLSEGHTEQLRLLYQISSFTESTDLESYIQMRNSIIEEKSVDMKKACCKFLEEKRVEMTPSSVQEKVPSLIYHIALLEEQTKSEYNVKGLKSDVLKIIFSRIYKGQYLNREVMDQLMMITGMKLLQANDDCRLDEPDIKSSGQILSYSCNSTQTCILNGIETYLSKIDNVKELQELFENELVFTAFDRLDRETKYAFRKQMSIYMCEASGKWCKKYGVQKRGLSDLLGDMIKDRINPS